MIVRTVSVLIETYWNVNKILPRRPAAEEVVLIETYWNVNFGRAMYEMYLEVVLIETYWNVNYIKHHLPLVQDPY